MTYTLIEHYLYDRCCYKPYRSPSAILYTTGGTSTHKGITSSHMSLMRANILYYKLSF